jgi:hypothetical protein
MSYVYFNRMIQICAKSQTANAALPRVTQTELKLESSGIYRDAA